LKIENFSEIQQDTLVQPQQRQSQPSLNIAIPKPQLDLERAEEVMRQFEQREQEIIVLQDSMVSPAINFVDGFAVPDSKISDSRIPDSTISGVSIIDSVETKIFESLNTVKSLNLGESFYHAERQNSYPSSVTLFLTCGLVLLTIIRYNFGKSLLEALHSFFSYRKSLRIYEERRESDRQAAILSNILFTWITGIFISIALPFFGGSPLWGSYVLSVLFFSAATGLLYILKSLIWQALGIIFMMQNLSQIYVYNMFLYNRNIGVMIFPLVAVIPYVSEVISYYILYSVLSVFAISYLFKLWRIFQIIHIRSVSVFYFILYLCTLEFLPLLLLVKGCKVLNEFVLFL